MRRTDDLQYRGLVLMQDTDLPCFTEDAVLLANFMAERLSPSDRVADLGSGSGIISVLGTGKTGAEFVGIEKQAALTALAKESAAMNGQTIAFYTMDVSDAPAAFGHGRFTAAVCNPPYFAEGPASGEAHRAAARHGDADTLHNFFHAAFLLLNNGGKFFVCYPAERMCDLFVALRAERLEPKRAKLILPAEGKPPRLLLVEAKKGAKPGIRWEAI